MNYYRDSATTGSWQTLQNLARSYKFVLIGGWAVWLYTHALKSKDIDLIVEFNQLEKLKSDFDLTKNDRLKKYEIVQGEIQIDIYVPHYSQLGHPIPQIISSATVIDGFRVPPPEILLTLKLTAYKNRAGSTKGHKDLMDIASLLSHPPLDWSKVPSSTLDIFTHQTSLPELQLNPHRLSRLKKLWSVKLKSAS